MKRIIALLALALALAVPFSASAGSCPDTDTCADTRTFTASISNFRVSQSGRHRVLTVTLNVHNKSDTPLTLAYVADSGVAMDENGNRYVVANAQAVRGIGLVTGNTFDPKFTLQAGEAKDTRFELVWNPGREIVGVNFELDMAIREIDPVTADQYRLGAEHALHFAGLAEGAGMAAAATPATGAPAAGVPASGTPAATASPAAATPRPDPCAGVAQCYDAGNFTAEVVQVSPGNMGSGVRHHTLALNLRFRNVTDRPVILGYQASSSAGIDNFGNAYYWGRAGTVDGSVKGMGIVTSRSADTQFVLQPGQSRNATFNLARYNAKAPIGNAWGYDVVIDELEILPGQQVRTARENSLNFQNIVAGAFSAGALPTGDAETVEVANQVIDLFKKLKD